MKAYQVFKGDVDKHGHQYYDLVATYLDKDRALSHCEDLARQTPLYGDVLEFDGWWGDGKFAGWSAVGWDRVGLSQFREIEITE
jgi:hypothetical protein